MNLVVLLTATTSPATWRTSTTKKRDRDNDELPIVSGNIFRHLDVEENGVCDVEDELEDGGVDGGGDGGDSGGDGGDSGGDSGGDGGDSGGDGGVSGGEGGEVPRGEPSKKKTRQERKIWNWAKGDLDPKEMPTNNIRRKNLEDCSFPVDIFLKMFGFDNLRLLTEQTNIQRAKEYSHVPPISLGEIRETLGILMYMSVVKMPNIYLFWKKSMNIVAVSRVMSRNRFGSYSTAGT